MTITKLIINNLNESWKPNKDQARDYAEKMKKIDDFCKENDIYVSISGDSYYFNIAGQDYRVSNHTISKSDEGMFNEFGEKIRDSYHTNNKNVICITAGKTRIIDIYNNLKAGKKLDKRGNVINESNLYEKASIDWNNYLTKNEVIHLHQKDDKDEAAEDVIYSNEFKDRYEDFKKSGWKKPELRKDLATFIYKGNLTESKKSNNILWKTQVDKKNNLELQDYLNKLYKRLNNFNDTPKSNELRSTEFYDLLNKITYIEDKLGIRPKLGRIIH